MPTSGASEGNRISGVVGDIGHVLRAEHLGQVDPCRPLERPSRRSPARTAWRHRLNAMFLAVMRSSESRELGHRVALVVVEAPVEQLHLAAPQRSAVAYTSR